MELRIVSFSPSKSILSMAMRNLCLHGGGDKKDEERESKEEGMYSMIIIFRTTLELLGLAIADRNLEKGRRRKNLLVFVGL